MTYILKEQNKITSRGEDYIEATIKLSQSQEAQLYVKEGDKPAKLIGYVEKEQNND